MRRKRAAKRERLPDPIYNSKLLTAVIGKILQQGKRDAAESIVYGTIDELAQKTGRPGLEVFMDAINNVKPVMEVKTRRVGGANYQVPIEVRPDRAETLAILWVVSSARTRKGKSMIEKMTNELMDAFNNTGASIKKKDDTHKMAEANKAFAHFKF